MLKIKLNSTDHIFMYDGKIKITFDSDFLIIETNSDESGKEDDLVWSKQLFDKFWLCEVESIEVEIE